MIMKRLSILFMLLLGATFSFAQDIESELGFIYVKAEYLLDTDRYEDAIVELTKIIDQDASFKDVLFKRAQAKFAIAAFVGAKRDLLQSFEVKGITPESLLLFGKAQRDLDEVEASTTTLKTAEMLSARASSQGSPSKRMPKTSQRDDSGDDNEMDDSGSSNNDKTTGEKVKDELDELDAKVNDILDDLLGKGDDSKDEDENDEPEEEVYVPDNSVNEIYIDEDLTVLIKDGLGGRKILDQPNILILSETSGDVTVDVCVNRNGKVTSAEFNKSKSSLSIQSLVSLAVRKSKEFWFEGVDRGDEVCGTIVFKITGRS